MIDRVFDITSGSTRQSSANNRHLVLVEVAVHELIGLAPSERAQITLLPVLTGVMQSPSGRISAIFQINNASISAEIGESVGRSGWTLESVGASSAVIRNNGQEQTLSVGGVF